MSEPMDPELAAAPGPADAPRPGEQPRRDDPDLLGAAGQASTEPGTAPDAEAAGEIAADLPEEAEEAEETGEPAGATFAVGTDLADEAVEPVAQPEPPAPLAAEPLAAEPLAAEPLTRESAAARTVLVQLGTQAPAPVALEAAGPAVAEASLSRRAFLGFGLAIAGGLAGAAALARLFPVFEDGSASASPIAGRYDPAGKQWTFVVDTASCIGCGLCVVACKEENHVPEEAAYTRTWVERHVTTTDGAMYVDSPEAGMYGFPPQSTAPGAAGKSVEASYFEPRLCMQCEDSPCTQVCPVGATYRTEDGIVLVDSRRCIGCGYCVVACPYGARYLVPAGGDAPNDMPGVADKCTWCYHRISQGLKPACVEVCPVGARQFGDATDPASDIATLVRERHPKQLNPEYGTRPRVLYLGPAIEEA